MKLLPIVPGCWALVIRDNGSSAYSPVKAGSEVQILDRLPRDGRVCPDCKTDEKFWRMAGTGYASCECSLLRIDGNDDQFRKEVARQQKPRQCVKAVHD